MDIEVIKEETWIDKHEWGDGPWLNEPDRAEWRIGPFVGLARRSADLGFWCGYLGVPPGHPWHGKGYDELDVEVHGGLGYASACDEDGPLRERICHVPRPGEPADVWWFGFDCYHFMDLAPGHTVLMRHVGLDPDPDLFPNVHYRDLDYVKREVLTLALQAAMAE